jgi:hypothetical protein
MTKKFAFIAFPLVLLAALFAVTPSLSVPKKMMATASQRVDVSEIGRSVPAKMTSFEDTYQRHMGVLDVLKAP